MIGTDTRLRRLLRDARHDPLLREQAKAEMERAGLTLDAIRRTTYEGITRAFVDLMEYETVFCVGFAAQIFDCDIFRAVQKTWTLKSEIVDVRAFYPTPDEIIDLGGQLDLRFSVGASLKERSLAIECVQECFPGAVVVSSQVANGSRPPRLEDLKPIDDEAA